MAITMRGLRAAAGSLDEQYRRTYQRTYRVHSDDLVADDEEAVLSFLESSGFVIGATHPNDPGARILGVSCAVVARATDATPLLVWDCVINWGYWNPLDHTDFGDPLEQPIRFRLDPVTVEVPLFVDVDGFPIVNSAGDPFDPPVTEERTQYILTVMRNEADPDIPGLVELSDRSRVNAAAWNGFALKTVKSLPVKIPERIWSQKLQILYYPMEYTFHIDSQTWTRKVLDLGMRELYSSGTKRRQIVDEQGNPISSPVLLNGSGAVLAQPIYGESITPLEFEVFEPIDFGVFELDSIPF